MLRPYLADKNVYEGTVLLRLNTLTGVAELVPEPPARVERYLLDAAGQPRLAIAYDDLKVTTYYRRNRRRQVGRTVFVLRIIKIRARQLFLLGSVRTTPCTSWPMGATIRHRCARLT